MATTKITSNVIADDAITSDQLGGDLTMPGHVSLADNKELRIGTGNDLVIKHDATDTIFTNTTGNLVLAGSHVYIANAANNEYMGLFIADGAASLRFNNVEELATVSGGVYVPNKLGIGTNSPTSSLHVFNNESGGTSTLRLRNSHTDKITRIQLEDSQGSVGDALIAYVHSDASSANHYLGMGVNNQTTLTMNNDDKVGIGTTAPDSFLHIKGSKTLAATEEQLKIENTATGEPVVLSMMALADNSGTGNEGAIYFDAGANGVVGNNLLQLSANHQNSTTPQVTITGDDKVGIGTTGPARTLEINGGGYNQLMIASNASSNTNKLAGIESRNYSNYALGLIQMFANSSQTGLYHGSADTSAKGVTDHYFMTSPSVDSATNNTVMKLTSARNVEITDGNLSFASGHGIDFGATSNSTGNLGVELLNDYEDGTWTPVLVAGVTNPTGGGALAPSGRYTKIGNRVWVTFYVGRSWTNSPSGQIYIDGLPYTVHSSTNGYYTGSVATYNVTFGSSGSPFLIPDAGSTTMSLYASNSGGTWTSMQWQTHAASSSGTYVTGTLSYHV